MDKYKNIATILYVEDEDGVRKGFMKTLNRYAKEVYEARDGQEGLELYKKYKPDIVISDIKMPRMNGIEMSRAIKEIDKDQSIIITTAHSESNYLLEAISLQLCGYILKPVDKNVLKDKILEIVKYQQLQIELEKNRILMSDIANLQKNMLLVYDENDDIIFANQMFFDFFNSENIEVFKSRYNCICDVINENENFYSCSHDVLLKCNWTDEFLKLSDDKRIISFRDTKEMKEKIFLVNIQKVALTKHKICTFSEITTLATKKNEYQQKAYVDELTKIYNRAKFNEKLREEIIKYKQTKDNLSLIMFDIDHFKDFNDTYGHQMGDEILSTLATIVADQVRDTDLFARWGGEEFVVLLPNANIQSALKIAQSKRELIEKHIFKDNLRVTCSFGVATMSDGDDKDSFLKKVDDALYRAKANGRNCAVT